MKNSGSSIAKGIGVGMLVGGAMTIIGSSMMNSKKANYKKMAKKAIKSAESFMDSMMWQKEAQITPRRKNLPWGLCVFITIFYSFNLIYYRFYELYDIIYYKSNFVE